MNSSRLCGRDKAILRFACLAMMLPLMVLFGGLTAVAQTTGFTYQGKLTDSGNVANGSYDLQFTLWDAATGGSQQPQPSPLTVTRSAVSVNGGVFTVQLDFGANAFPGADRFLEISVRPSGGTTFTTLSPRQQISSTPYAIRSASTALADTATTSTSATNATNAAQLGGVAASQYVLTTDSRLSDARPPTAGSSNYIQNNSTSSAQSASFDISGNGTLGGNLMAAGNTVVGNKPVGWGLAANGAVGNLTVNGAAIIGYQNFNRGLATGDLEVMGTLVEEGNAYFVSRLGIGTLGPSYPLSVVTSAGTGPDQAAAEFANNVPDTGVRINNTSGGGRKWTLFSSGAGSGIGVGNFNIYDATAGQSRISIDPSGNIGIGTTSPSTSLTVNGCVTATNISCPSDARLKQNIKPLSYGLREVLRLHPVRWQWKDTTATQLNLGLVAQDVEPVLPELVLHNVDAKGSLGLNYEGLIPVLVKGIQEQQAQIENQQEELKQQKDQIERERAENAAQQQELKALKSLLCRSHRHSSVCK